MLHTSTPRRAALALGAAFGLPAGPAAAQAAQPQWAPERAPPAARRPGMTLTFAEEFTEFVWSVDGRRGWRTNFPYGRTLASNKEAQYYSDASVGTHPFRLLDGVLEITAAPGQNPDGLPYVSGLITTRESFAQRYGHFEMRARLPRGRGLWPAFWLLPADRTWPPEIDVVEMLGHRPDTIHVALHWKVDGQKGHKGVPVTVGDVTTGFHDYGVSWRADEIRFFFDGRQIAALPTPPDMHKPMFMVANLAVGGPGSWPGPPDANTEFPARMLIDHIRAWRFDGE
jgi:beta-glucanase (GH16 family)